MKIINKIFDLLLMLVLITSIYLYFPSILKLINNIDTNSISISNKIGSIKDLGKLVSDNDITYFIGSSGDKYSFDSEFYPYYGLLDDNYKKLYKQIYANAVNLKNDFTPLIEVTKDEVSNVIESVMYDHPELFWLDNCYSYKYNSNGECLQINLKFNNTYKNFNNNKVLFEKKANEIINEAMKYNSDLEKEKFVHNKLVNILTYDDNSNINQSAYSALVNNKSVCAGYSKAFQYIMIKLGIPCYYVTGDSSGDHAWNLVKIDNNYYNVDLTWDNTGSYMYEFFNRSDSEFSKTHTRSLISSKLPNCYINGNSKSDTFLFLERYAD